MKNINDIILGVIGLGYVGLPLAVSFGKKIKVIGFDVNKERVKQLKNHADITGETTTEDLLESKNLKFSSNLHDLTCCDVFIIAVPTGIDKNHNPDFFHLLKASETVGSVMKDGSIVIYESTVFPGCTEEECIPVLQKFSGKKFNEDFYVGYSPERINPGDKEHTFEKITKITSGSTPEIASFVDDLYNLVLHAGTFKVSNIKTAEAAKVIQNAQRDINIAFVNELSNIFSRLGIDTKQVLEAAGTKWSFLKFKPGLVGGHCLLGNEEVVVNDMKKTLKELYDSVNEYEIVNDNESYKLVKDILKVRSFNQQSKKTEDNNLSILFKMNVSEYIEFIFEDKGKISCSTKHPFYVGDNMKIKFAEMIYEGQTMPFVQKGNLIFKKIVEIKKFKKNTVVYCLYVDKVHNFITTNGLLTHNCIGIDPYWLMYKALEKNYFPQLINTARAINENISKDICIRIVQKMIDKEMKIKNSDVLILGFTFKENCHDIRNTKVYDIYQEFIDKYKCNVDIVDPWAYKEDVKREYNLDIYNECIKDKKYDVIILAVSHEDFRTIDLQKLKKDKSVIFDVKCFLNKNDVDDRL